MKKDPSLRFRIVMMLADALVIVLSFTFAYLIRTHIDQRPYYFEAEPLGFALTNLLLVPVWWVILALTGAYNKQVLMGKSRLSEGGRLFAASVIGVMTLITFDFFYHGDLFPVRPVAAYAAILCFVFLCIERWALRRLRARKLIREGRGALRAVIIGNSPNTERLIEHIMSFPEEGYQVAGVVARDSYVPAGLKKHKYSSLKEALKRVQADVIFQTDERQTEYVYGQSVKYHLLYYFVPSEAALSSHIGQMELIGNTPAILVKVTPLMGGARFVKRLMDVVLGGAMLILAAIPMAIIWLVEKLAEPGAPAIYSEYRLSRYNRRVKIYKFRSMRMEYSGISPEEAFTKMGRPELISRYRENGDYLPDDPRITKVGKFIRATSLDELPQLWNVVRGDIALVGPRALVPGELRNYGDRSLLLSVKSGLTGLAQVSGRRDISFDERRALDLYYIQNWSLGLDLQILVRTVGAVLFRRGAK